MLGMGAGRRRLRLDILGMREFEPEPGARMAGGVCQMYRLGRGDRSSHPGLDGFDRGPNAREYDSGHARSPSLRQLWLDDAFALAATRAYIQGYGKSVGVFIDGRVSGNPYWRPNLPSKTTRHSPLAPTG